MKRYLSILFLFVLSASAFSQKWAIVSVSVTDLKSEASYESETVSQALMGTPVQIVDKNRYWYKIITPEDYSGWTTDKNISPLADAEFEKWKESERGIVTAYFETIKATPAADSEIIGNCIMGNIVEMTDERVGGFVCIILPDGEKGFISETSIVSLRKKLESMEASGETIVAAAKKFIGFPYLWGGCSPLGMDCSGLVKLACFLNGIIVKRDVKDQIATGEELTMTPDFKNLQKGDLLFFASPASSPDSAIITHVGIYIENGEFIHSSLIVRCNNLFPDREDYYADKKVAGACRILGYQDEKEGIISILRHPWYFKQKNK